MAHTRNRHLTPHVKKLARYSPIVGVLGHRQVGKTTLLEQMAATYVTMDARSEINAATSDPDSYVERFEHFPVGIDECQLCPDLFAALKDRVRRVKRPGQFLPTGSVRFTSRKVIKESLTGRIINVELHPLMVSELMNTSEPQVASYMLDAAGLNLDQIATKFDIGLPKLRKAEKTLLSVLQTGGLPGVCFVRDPGIRAQKFESQLETILTRDLRQLIETTLSFETLRAVLVNLAGKQGQPLSYAEISRSTRVSVPALRRLVEAFESLFLIWRLPCKGGEKRPSLFFEDAGEAYHLGDGRLDELSSWTATIATQVRSQFDIPQSGKNGGITHFWQYRTRGGVYVPLVVSRGKRSLGIIPIWSEKPSAKDLGSGRAFLKANKDSRVIYVVPNGATQLISRDMYVISGGMIVL